MFWYAQDVIGAAETGSGKTLAFSIPILQRLLDEQDKVLRQTDYSCESEEISGQMKKHSGTGSPLRALIITPTRELALQVHSHTCFSIFFTYFLSPIIIFLEIPDSNRTIFGASMR